MTLPIFLKTLRDLRWQVFWYGLGLALMAALIVYIYPSYSEQMADFELPDALRGFAGEADLATGAGFVSVEFFSWVPIVLAIFAIMTGSAALAGEESNGTLDMLLAQPMERSRLALEKVAGLFLATLAICAIAYLGWLASVPFVDIDVGLDELAVATLNLAPLAFLFQVFSMWAGVALPGKGFATGVAIAVAALSYFANYMATTAEAIEPLRYVSVFYYYHGDSVLMEGIDVPGLLLLSLLCLGFVVLTVVAFNGRDIGVNAPLRLPLLSWRT